MFLSISELQFDDAILNPEKLELQPESISPLKLN
jgi:hypothetical protein